MKGSPPLLDLLLPHEWHQLPLTLTSTPIYPPPKKKSPLPNSWRQVCTAAARPRPPPIPRIMVPPPIVHLPEGRGIAASFTILSVSHLP